MKLKKQTRDKIEKYILKHFTTIKRFKRIFYDIKNMHKYSDDLIIKNMFFLTRKSFEKDLKSWVEDEYDKDNPYEQYIKCLEIVGKKLLKNNV